MSESHEQKTHPTIEVRIDDQRTEVVQGTTILQAAQRLGLSIPALCHHPLLEPYAACRLCTVAIEVRGRSRLVTSCNYPIREPLQVQTASPEVLRLRRTLVRMMLARWPRVPLLLELAQSLDLQEPPLRHPAPEKDPQACILCHLCVQVCRDVVGANALNMAERGVYRRLTTPLDHFPEGCIACGACAAVCPTGHLTMEAQQLERLRQRWGEERLCRYALLDLTPGALCANDYQCWRCETDQLLMDRSPYHPAFLARGLVPGQEATAENQSASGERPFFTGSPTPSKGESP